MEASSRTCEPPGRLCLERTEKRQPLLVMPLKQRGTTDPTPPISISYLNVLLPKLNRKPSGEGAWEMGFVGVTPLSEQR